MSAILNAFSKVDWSAQTSISECWLRQSGSGEYVLNLPFAHDLKVPLHDPASDTGLSVAAILLNPQKTLNTRFLGASGYFTVDQLVEGFKVATGYKAKLNTLPIDTWASFLPEAVRDELKGNFQCGQKLLKLLKLL
jgi:hypothetical protein